MKSRSEFHHYTHIFGLVIMGMSLPLSKYLVSVSVFLLIANWIVAGNFKNKWMIGHQRKSLLLILSVLLVYCLGMIYTENSEDGLKRILSLMPLMAMTVILGTERPISRSELKVVLLAFVFAVCISSVISIGHYYGWFNRDISDIRQISVFISHLLLSLMVNMAIILLLYMVFYKYFATSKTENVFYLTLAAGLIYFIFLLKSFLGITVFVIFFPLFLFNLLRRFRSLLIRSILLSLTALLLVSCFAGIIYSLKRFYDIDKNELLNLEPYTLNGNPYRHFPDNKEIENGHHVWIYVCEPELEKEWNRQSHYPYDSLDMKGQPINQTLIRYLSSKGLKKDSEGIQQLSPEDIKLIESGYANYIFANKYGIYQRIYQVIWEIDKFIKTGDANSHSVGQRLGFAACALELIRNNLWFGVGTGDMKAAMVEQSASQNIFFQKDWEGKPHNQYLNFIISFGLVGFCWIILALLYPRYIEQKKHILPHNFFLGIYFVSMLSIDTFDAHVGISIFAFFYTLFLFYWERDEQRVTN